MKSSARFKKSLRSVSNPFTFASKIFTVYNRNLQRKHQLDDILVEPALNSSLLPPSDDMGTSLPATLREGRLRGRKRKVTILIVFAVSGESYGEVSAKRTSTCMSFILILPHLIG